MRKKIFSVILTLVLTIGTCSIAAAADRGSATRNSLKKFSFSYLSSLNCLCLVS